MHPHRLARDIRRLVAVALAVAALLTGGVTAAAADGLEAKPPEPCTVGDVSPGGQWLCVRDWVAGRGRWISIWQIRNLRNGHSGQCLAASGGNLGERVPIIQWPCTGGAEQYWVGYGDRSGYRQLVNWRSAKCLGVQDGSLVEGAGLIQVTCSSANEQWWRLETGTNGLSVWRNLHSGQVIGVGGGSLDWGARAVQWHYIAGVTDQTWALINPWV
jgi:hypothetical protein